MDVPFPFVRVHPLAHAAGKSAGKRTPTCSDISGVSMARDSDEVGCVAYVPVGPCTQDVQGSVFFISYVLV